MGGLSKSTNLTRHKAAKFQVKYSKSTEIPTSVQVQLSNSDRHSDICAKCNIILQYTFRLLCSIKSNTDSDICASAASTAIRFRLLCRRSINSNIDSDFCASAASTAILIQTSVQVQHQEQHRFRHLCKCNINSNIDSDFCAGAASTEI